jgi:DNA-directed RNA polymerase specialized sigma24 family protein
MTSVQAKKRKRRIPDFQSYEEEANFWDTNSPLDFPDEFDFEADDVTFASPLEIVRVKEWRKTLNDALAALPDDQRQVLALSLLGLYPDEIGRVMGRSAAEAQKALRAAGRRSKIAV